LAVAEQLKKFKIEVDAKIEAGVKKDEAIFQVLKDYIIASKPIRFEGNGYGQEWIDEAKKRGLSNVKETVDALQAFVSEETKKLCVGNGIFTERELEARHEIKVAHYTKKIQIESRVLGDLATNHIIPTVYKYQNQLIENVRGLKQVLDPKDFDQIAGIQLQTIKEISGRISLIKIKVKNMVDERKKANALTDIYEKARMYSEEVKPYLSEIRYHIDHLEMIVDNEIWPLPKYRELLFAR
jgi:glutamine synthetase